MRGHPVIELAAVALLLGIDPVRFLSRRGVERAVMEEVVHRAWELRVEEIQARGPML